MKRNKKNKENNEEKIIEKTQENCDRPEANEFQKEIPDYKRKYKKLPNSLKPNKRPNVKEIMKYSNKFLLLTVIITSILGMIAISTAVISYKNSYQFLIVQSIAIILGIIIAFFTIKIGYSNIVNSSGTITFISILLLILVLIPNIGTGLEEKGGRSWFRIGGIGLQPSEISKIGFIIGMAKLIANMDTEINKPINILKLLAYVGMFVSPILAEPDAGMTLEFIFIMILMIFFSPISYKYILSALGFFLSFIPFAWFFLLKSYQKNRILNFLNPENDPLASGYQVFQSKIAIGSGKIFGKGFMKGTSVQFGFLPEKHTDFIFSVIGEEFGFIGAIVIIILISMIVFECINIARKNKNPTNLYTSIGVSGVLIFQMLENIGMCIGLTPVTGITLCFLSYGGSSIISNLACIGLVLAIDFEQKYENNIKNNME